MTSQPLGNGTENLSRRRRPDLWLVAPLKPLVVMRPSRTSGHFLPNCRLMVRHGQALDAWTVRTLWRLGFPIVGHGNPSIIGPHHYGTALFDPGQCTSRDMPVARICIAMRCGIPFLVTFLQQPSSCWGLFLLHAGEPSESLAMEPTRSLVALHLSWKLRGFWLG